MHLIFEDVQINVHCITCGIASSLPDHRLETIYLLEEEKNDFKVQHAMDISLLEKRLQESELAKVRAQEQVNILSRQNDHESMKLLVEESKADANRLQGRIEQLEKEKQELQKERKGVLFCFNTLSSPFHGPTDKFCTK